MNQENKFVGASRWLARYLAEFLSCGRTTGAPLRTFLPFLFIIIFSSALSAADVLPVLEFPEAGMDDPARYRQYSTRFIRDSSKNALQIYIAGNSGRVVHLWADAANESLSFTARDAGGKPAPLEWCSKGADATSIGQRRDVEHSLCIASDEVEIGHFLLGTMRKERDFQYFEKHLKAFDGEAFHEPELLKLIQNLGELPEEERRLQLQTLQAKSPEELRSRMDPKISIGKVGTNSVASIEQISFDGKNHLWLTISSDATSMQMKGQRIVIRAPKSPLTLRIRVGTDSAALAPLDRKQIFNDEFFRFYNSLNKDSLEARWIEREVRGMELVCYQEKLMAGLPNFATYFGRDTMMSALMFEPLWSTDMMEHALTSVLRKLSPDGHVSHEEALGGQAIRENADEYNKTIERYMKSGADATALEAARKILADLQRMRENYKMVDDDFQFPVLLGRYLNDREIDAQRKRKFLNGPVGPGGVTRLSLILKNFAYVLSQARPYISRPQATNLVSFPKRNDGGWMSASWRDSNAGYAGGRFAMDVNVVWVPMALESIAATLDLLRSMSIAVPKDFSTDLKTSARVWKDAWKHFQVRLKAEDISGHIKNKIASLPTSEQTYWNSMLKNSEMPAELQFLALSLNENGEPIPVLSTDLAMVLFMQPYTQMILNNQAKAEDVYALIQPILLPYPAGLSVQSLGPLCANDAYASPQIWQSFEKDLYHSPRVVWGREVNLFSLGLMGEILDAYDKNGKLKDRKLLPYVSTLAAALRKTREAVEASGLKHNELWSYRIENGKLMPARYGSTSDIQLWNLTDLSIQYFLKRLAELRRGGASALK